MDPDEIVTADLSKAVLTHPLPFYPSFTRRIEHIYIGFLTDNDSMYGMYWHGIAHQTTTS
jgi:hypothetical protein